MADLSLRLVIRGRVQGVGFRYWMTREAEKRGLSGWVRNLPDGTVEALVSGPDAAIQDIIDVCRRGPRLAHVESVEQSLAEAPAQSGFQQFR
jgi:acylphosphatase